MAKKNSKSISQDIEDDAQSIKAQAKKAVSDKASRNIVAALAVLIGILLILFNLSGIVMALAGLVLIYLGMKLFGYSIPMPKM